MNINGKNFATNVGSESCEAVSNPRVLYSLFLMRIQQERHYKKHPLQGTFLDKNIFCASFALIFEQQPTFRRLPLYKTFQGLLMFLYYFSIKES